MGGRLEGKRRGERRERSPIQLEEREEKIREKPERTQRTNVAR
jgi:hypothetical protein